MLRAVALILALWIGFTADPPPSSTTTEGADDSQYREAVIVKEQAEDETSLSSIAAPHVHVASGEAYRVVKVIDGDTLTVEIDGIATTLRLIGLDTPETLDPRKPVQCFGREASDKAKALLTGKEVRLEYDKTQGVLDKYDRTLAYLYLPDGTLYNEYMIAEGFAHEYTYNIPYAYQARFQAAETAARAGEKGLWADEACAAESDRDAPTSAAAPLIVPDTDAYICSRNAYNCTDFSTHQEAQRTFEACGGAMNDIHLLDRDADGVACETLP